VSLLLLPNFERNLNANLSCSQRQTARRALLQLVAVTLMPGCLNCVWASGRSTLTIAMITVAVATVSTLSMEARNSQCSHCGISDQEFTINLNKPCAMMTMILPDCFALIARTGMPLPPF